MDFTITDHFGASELTSEEDQDGLPNPFNEWTSSDVEDLDYYLKQAVMPLKYVGKHRFSSDFWISFPEAFLAWFPELGQDVRDFLRRDLFSLICSGFAFDDIQDQTSEIGGQPTSSTVYKGSWTMLGIVMEAAAKYCLVNSPSHLLNHFSPEGPAVLCKADFLGTCGQYIEHQFVGIDSIRMMDYKVATITKFAAMSTRTLLLAEHLSGRTLARAHSIGAALSYLSTMSNEYAALFSDQYKEKKKRLAEDITLGLFSYAIIKAMDTEDRDLFKVILRKQTDDEVLLQFAVDRLRQLGIKRDMEVECARALARIKKDLKALPPNPIMDALLSALEKKASSRLGIDY